MTMKCMFCDKDMLNYDGSMGLPVTLPGRGIAHTYCAEQDLFSRRIFGSIHIKDLPNDDLYELRELVLAEINEREGLSQEPELF